MYVMYKIQNVRIILSAKKKFITVVFWLMGLKSQCTYLIINDKLIVISVWGQISEGMHSDNTHPTLPPTDPHPLPIPTPFPPLLIPTPYPPLPIPTPNPPNHALDPSPSSHFLTLCHSNWQCTNKL